MREFEEKL